MNDVILNVFITLDLNHLEKTLNIPTKILLSAVNKICI